MNTNEIYKKLSRAIIGLGIALFVAVLFRFWTLFFVALSLLIGAIVWRRILKSKAKKNEIQPEEKEACNKAKDNQMSIGEQVSMYVRMQYPEAKWIWAQSDTAERIAAGDEVFILLNRAGGYRRARVILKDNIVSAIEISKASEQPKIEQNDVSVPQESKDVKPQAVNYGLIAFEWVEEHICKLNERFNDVIGNGNSEIILTVEELPVSESWANVCEELKRVGIPFAECIENGIKIKLKQESAKEE